MIALLIPLRGGGGEFSLNEEISPEVLTLKNSPPRP